LFGTLLTEGKVCNAIRCLDREGREEDEGKKGINVNELGED
jgi:hypothetical protein